MTHKISHSDIKAFNKCEYRWYYERYRNLMPAGGYPEVMETGTFGHSLMEAGFNVFMNGGTYEEAAEAAGALLVDVLDSVLKMKVYKNVLAFFSWYLQQDLRVVAIEDKQSVPINENVEFGFTPDLVVEHLSGTMRGSQTVMDYKFTGQYWSDREINAFQQVPKYILYRNKATGSNIRRGAVVMLNTRATPTDTGNKLFLVKWIPVTSARFKLLERENELMVNKIYDLTELGNSEGHDALKEKLVHTADEKACKFCFFGDDLCPMEQNGRDITRTIKNAYKQNKDYGYNGEQDVASTD